MKTAGIQAGPATLVIVVGARLADLDKPIDADRAALLTSSTAYVVDTRIRAA